MKNNFPFYITIISVLLSNVFAQNTKVSPANIKMKETQAVTNTKPELMYNSVRTIKLYHVVENINMKFGGYTTTYEVSDSSLINSNNLGPNNTRVVTFRFIKKEQLSDLHLEVAKSPLKLSLKPNNSGVMEHSKKNLDYALIDILKTYERIAIKGYKSIEIFKALGDAYYFNTELDKSARWYGELFNMTSDLEPAYYYRYAQSLLAIGQNKKANAMLEKFNQKVVVIKEKPFKKQL